MATQKIRILIIEDVPQVTKYLRDLVGTQHSVEIIDVLTDGSHAISVIPEKRPHVIVLDALLQGSIKGLELAAQIRAAAPEIPIVAITVPQEMTARNPAGGVDAVLTIPFTAPELMHAMEMVRAAMEGAREQRSRIVAVFGPKGGVGRTTIALNVAAAAAALGTRTILIDGSLQFADVRTLLQAPPDAPSILDLPTDRVTDTDLEDVLWHDPSGLDVLLAPPRIEMAEMVTPRDVAKILSLLRRVYPLIVVDLAPALSEVSLAILDAADTVLEVVTQEWVAVRTTALVGETFRALGYPESKIQLLVNRAADGAGIDEHALAEVLGRQPEYRVVSDGRLVVSSNDEGIPFVLRDPESRISRDIVAVACALTGRPAGTGLPKRQGGLGRPRTGAAAGGA